MLREMIKFFVIFTVFLSARPSISAVESLEAALPSNPFFIAADEVLRLSNKFRMSSAQILVKLVPIVSQHARALITGSRNGNTFLGISGSIYAGVNLEFPGLAGNQFVHAEQFALAKARHHGEKKLLAMGETGVPLCGHCRHFVSELGPRNGLKIVNPDRPDSNLASWLPRSYRSRRVQDPGGILSQRPHHLNPASLGSALTSSALVAAAFDVAEFSYAPYSACPSGVALRLADGKIYKGSYLEVAAYNPSMQPLQNALVALVADQKEYSQIKEAVLVEKRGAGISQAAATKDLLRVLGRNIRFKAFLLK